MNHICDSKLASRSSSLTMCCASSRAPLRETVMMAGLNGPLSALVKLQRKG